MSILGSHLASTTCSEDLEPNAVIHSAVLGACERDGSLRRKGRVSRGNGARCPNLMLVPGSGGWREGGFCGVV